MEGHDTSLCLCGGYGVPQQRYEPREVRKVLFGDYEVHYEASD
jgi:hypothetical protein